MFVYFETQSRTINSSFIKMANSFLNALKRIFNPVERDNEPTRHEPADPKVTADHDEAAHVVQLREDVVRRLIDNLQALHGIEDNVTSITLWTTDTVTALALKDDDFINLLRLRLDDADFDRISLTDHVLRHDDAPAGARQLCHNVSFTLNDNGPTPTDTPSAPGARISLSEVSGHGTLAQPVYMLDTRAKTEFRLGRGLRGSRDTHWTNDIVVRDDDTPDVMARFNSYVSSQQAILIFRNGNFYLQATPSGCRDTGGCATKIISGADVRELTDTSQLHLLHDGDIIELGKHVRIAVTLT